MKISCKSPFSTEKSFTLVPVTGTVMSFPPFKKIIRKVKKQENMQSEEIKLASELDSDLAEILECSLRNFKQLH